MRSTAAAHGAWPQRPLRPKRSHWSRPHIRLLCAAQRTFASHLSSQPSNSSCRPAATIGCRVLATCVHRAHAVRSVVRLRQARPLAWIISVPQCKPGTRTALQRHRKLHRPAGANARIRFPQRAASTLCGKPGVAAGGLSGIASPVAFQHPIPNHFGIEARERAARVVREGIRAILRGQQPVEDLHPCGGADPRIEQSAQRLVQQAPVKPDEVIVRPRAAFARGFCSLGADQRRLSWPRAIGQG